MAPSDDTWIERERYWRRKLGRIRLGVEPPSEQLAKYRRATIGLSIVTLGMAAIIIALFLAFGAPRVGFILTALIFLPIIALAWLDDWLLRRRVARYEHELRLRAESSAARPTE